MRIDRRTYPSGGYKATARPFEIQTMHSVVCKYERSSGIVASALHITLTRKIYGMAGSEPLAVRECFSNSNLMLRWVFLALDKHFLEGNTVTVQMLTIL